MTAKYGDLLRYDDTKIILSHCEYVKHLLSALQHAENKNITQTKDKEVTATAADKKQNSTIVDSLLEENRKEIRKYIHRGLLYRFQPQWTLTCEYLLKSSNPSWKCRPLTEWMYKVNCQCSIYACVMRGWVIYAVIMIIILGQHTKQEKPNPLYLLCLCAHTHTHVCWDQFIYSNKHLNSPTKLPFVLALNKIWSNIIGMHPS